MPNETLAEERARLKRETKALGKNLKGSRKPAVNVSGDKKPVMTARKKALKKAKETKFAPRSLYEKYVTEYSKKRDRTGDLAEKMKSMTKDERDKAKGDFHYEEAVNKYQREKTNPSSFSRAKSKLGDKVGDAIRSTGFKDTDYEDDKMQARKDIKGYKTGGVARGSGIARKGIRACKIR